MDDNFVDEYLNKRIDEILGPNPDPVKKQQWLDYFQNLILDTVIDNLTDEQIQELNSLQPNSPQMETKLEQFSSLIPDLAIKIQQKIDEEFNRLQTNPQ